MNRTTRTTVAVLGLIAGMAGIEHGIGEVLQGSAPPPAVVIKSWPNTAAFDILGGEPAMTLVPDLLASGVLSILVGLVFSVWVTLFIHRKHGGLVLILLSLALLLVGGGFGPPLLGLILGLAATRINAPLDGWRTYVPAGLRKLLAQAWPWLLGACLVAWLSMFPGTVLLAHFFGVNDPAVVYALALCMFSLLFLTLAAAFSRDVHAQAHPWQLQTEGFR
jgi:hypothetical protein